MFKKILIANRGEIACRIIRAAKELGVPTVAMYSAVDAKARHVRLADGAVQTGADPLDTYLNIENIVNLALEVGADAIHRWHGGVACCRGDEHLRHGGEHQDSGAAPRDRGDNRRRYWKGGDKDSRR